MTATSRFARCGRQPTADLWRGNTLAAPYFKNPDGTLKTFDFAVANPPFSAKAWSSGLDPTHDEFRRFEYGIPPAKNGDYGFLLHLVASLKSRGKGAIILPHGVLFRGNREADIRRNLVRRGLLKGIISLPANLFYGTGIPACILVVDKENAHARDGIFMIDASRGFAKEGNKNRLRAQDIHRIVDVFNRRTEVSRYARMVPLTEIAGPANDYNLNLPRYIDSSEPEDLHDLEAHLEGGIPDHDIDGLESYWKVFPSVRRTLFTGNGRAGYSEARVETQQVKATILGHDDFELYRTRVTGAFDGWRETHEPLLKDMGKGVNPKDIAHALSEDLLARFADFPLLDPYDVYQRLVDYWDETMQDDVYLIASEGWVEAARPRGVIEDKDRKLKETPDLTSGRRKYKMDLIPPALVVTRYFAAEQAVMDELQRRREGPPASWRNSLKSTPERGPCWRNSSMTEERSPKAPCKAGSTPFRMRTIRRATRNGPPSRGALPSSKRSLRWPRPSGRYKPCWTSGSLITMPPSTRRRSRPW